MLYSSVLLLLEWQYFLVLFDFVGGYLLHGFSQAFDIAANITSSDIVSHFMIHQPFKCIGGYIDTFGNRDKSAAQIVWRGRYFR